MANPADIVQVLFLTIVMVLSLLGNCAILYVILRVRRLHCPTGFLLVNLAMIDVMMTVTLLPMRIPGILVESRVFDATTCMIIGYIQNLLSYACVLTVVAISMDRYLAIVLPLRYKSRVTGTRTSIAITCIWVFSIFCSCFPFFGFGKYSFIPGLWLCDSSYQTVAGFMYFKLSSSYFVPLIIISYLYFKIFRVSRHHSKQIRREVEAMNFRENSASMEVETQVGKINDVSGQFCLRKPHSALKSEVKTALTLGFVVGALFVSWAPHIVLTVWTSCSTHHNNMVAYEVSSFMYYLNVMINPYIYGYLNRTIKSQLKKYVNNILDHCSSLCAKTNKVTPSIIVIAPGDESRMGNF